MKLLRKLLLGAGLTLGTLGGGAEKLAKFAKMAVLVVLALVVVAILVGWLTG